MRSQHQSLGPKGWGGSSGLTLSPCPTAEAGASAQLRAAAPEMVMSRLEGIKPRKRILPAVPSLAACPTCQPSLRQGFFHPPRQ